MSVASTRWWALIGPETDEYLVVRKVNNLRPRWGKSKKPPWVLALAAAVARVSAKAQVRELPTRTHFFIFLDQNYLSFSQ